MKLKPFIQKVGNFAYQLGILILILYLGFILFRQINVNYKTNLKIKEFRRQISSLERQNNNLGNLLIYYQSNIYKELEARKRIGLKKEGEKALVVPENKDKDMEMEKIEEQQVNGEKPVQENANYLKWYREIFENQGLSHFP